MCHVVEDHPTPAPDVYPAVATRTGASKACHQAICGDLPSGT